MASWSLFPWLYHSSNNLISLCSLLIYLAFVNTFLATLCQYGSQTFSANQSVITSNCTERCQCHYVNGTAVTKCKRLCPIQDDPKCHSQPERIKEFQISLNDTNCTCTERRCISGINTALLFLLLKCSTSTETDELAESLWKSLNLFKGSRRDVLKVSIRHVWPLVYASGTTLHLLQTQSNIIPCF